MVDNILHLNVILVFTLLTCMFGYCAWTEEVWGPPFLAMVFQGTATFSFAVYAALEFWKKC